MDACQWQQWRSRGVAWMPSGGSDLSVFNSLRSRRCRHEFSSIGGVLWNEASYSALVLQHAPMPTQKLRFQEQKITQTWYHSIIFGNTLANISSHLWNKSGCQILQENHTAIYLTDSAQLRMLFCRSHLLPISPIISQQHWELQSSCKCHLSCQRWRKATFHGMHS